MVPGNWITERQYETGDGLMIQASGCLLPTFFPTMCRCHVHVEALDPLKSMVSPGAALYPAEIWSSPVRILRTHHSMLMHALLHPVGPLAMWTEENLVLLRVT